MRRSGVYALSTAVLFAGCASSAVLAKGRGNDDVQKFRRIATFPVFLNTSVDEETVAEIVTSASDGNLLVYTDSQTDNIGFVDISDPANPQPAGIVAVGGEPTSVAVKGDFALACVNTSADFVNTSGVLQVVDINRQMIVRSIDLGGQPDAIAVSPDGQYAAVCIENERDEDLGDGEPPQAPAGFVVIVDLNGMPAGWSTRNVNLGGVPSLFPNDAEPEFVDINGGNLAVVTLQENNEIVLIDLPTGEIVNNFSAGSVDLRNVDDDDDGVINQTVMLRDVPREPDAVAWIGTSTFATADEGDLFGGSRGFTTWNTAGQTLYGSGSDLEHITARLGHYPEGRSDNKGCEPEGVEYGRYGDDDLLFVGSERSSLVFVYLLPGRSISDARRPSFVQALPTGLAPEGLHAIPQRNLFVVASEEDSRDDKVRSSISIYQRGEEPAYPMIESANRKGPNQPIPWGALSGLVADGDDASLLYAIHDSAYDKSRIYTLDTSASPAVITSEIVLNDDDGVLLAALQNLKSNLPNTDEFDPAGFVNADGTVNVDPEGIALAEGGGFWIASEGAGNLNGGVSDPDNRPFESPNMLIKTSAKGTIERVVMPPLGLTRDQLRFGFEGVAVDGGYAYVAWQREWGAAGDPSNMIRIGRYEMATGEWGFAYYPLDAVESPNGGWVGASEATALGGGEFLWLERDNQGGPDAAVKRVYKFSVDGIEFKPFTDVPNFDVVSKQLVIDLMLEGCYDQFGGVVPEKLEGLAVIGDDVIIVNDNDGVDDNSGETTLLRLKNLLD